MVRYSTDNGLTWTNERTVSNTATFIRNVQITGDPVTGDVYIAGMDEGGGGFPHNDINKIYRSTDGGNTWTNTYTGPSFPGPGVTASGYFACMFAPPTPPPPTGVTRAGASRPPTTTSFTWFTLSMAPAPTLATFTISVLLIAARLSARHSS
jgi:hypothetical protein